MGKISQQYALAASGDLTGAPGKTVKYGVTTLTSASMTVVTGLAAVEAVVASLESSPVLTCSDASAQIGDQAGSPAAGSILLKAWMPTATGDATPVAATGFATKKVAWIAVGTL
jgi:hypothetical protein